MIIIYAYNVFESFTTLPKGVIHYAYGVPFAVAEFHGDRFDTVYALASLVASRL